MLDHPRLFQTTSVIVNLIDVTCVVIFALAYGLLRLLHHGSVFSRFCCDLIGIVALVLHTFSIWVYVRFKVDKPSRFRRVMVVVYAVCSCAAWLCFAGWIGGSLNSKPGPNVKLVLRWYPQ